TSRPIYTFLHPDDSAPCSVELDKILDGGEIVAFENRIMRKGGGSLWVQWNLAPMGDGLLAVTARDIEAMAVARQRLVQQKRFLEMAAGIAHVGYWRLELVRNALSWSSNTYTIFGVSPDAFVPSMDRFLSMHHPKDRDRVRVKLFEALRHNVNTTYKARIYPENGELRHIETRTTRELGSDGKPVAMFGVIQDVTEHEEALRAVEHAALHDPLTSLANRSKFHNRLIEALQRGKRDGRGTGLVLLDLDHFKDVNDAYGHPFGDKLLLEVTSRLRSNVRELDAIARLGGDEFAIVVESVTLASDIMPLAERLLESLGTPYVIDGKEIRSGVSIGIAIEPDSRLHAIPGNRVADQLIANADIALYSAKNEGRHGYVVFNQEMRFEFEEQRRKDQDLRAALDEQQFTLHYQPQINCQAGTLLGLEALIRWRHPKKGLLLPESFIPQTERIGLLAPMTDWVLDEVCRQQRAWQDRGLKPLPVAINIAPLSLRTENFAAHIAQRLEQYGLAPSSLIIEITEEAIADGDEAAVALRQLKDVGLQIALDDFGAGYSSLARLRDLPIDILKMDRSFVIGIDVDSNRAALAEAITRLAQSLNLKLVAEGVETEAQLLALGDIGCENVQGIMTGCPMDAATMFDWLARWSADQVIAKSQQCFFK
ncbi:MAG: bifunctional diguanylate cyclase/phosphodiesterase, partial [Geminicoccaceae bacterium]